MELQTPFSGRNRMNFTRSEYAKGIIGTLLLIVPVVGYAFEFKHFSNTFGIQSLLIGALGVGFVLGLLGGFYFSKNEKEGLEKLKIYLGFIFLGLLVTPLLASWINRGLASDIQMKEVTYKEQQVFSQSRFGQLEGKMEPDGCYLFFYKNRKLERVKTKQLIFPKNTPIGLIVEIPIREGGLGYDYFVEPIRMRKE